MKEVSYFNRELSWLEFNSRVLGEAENPDNPLLERLKFLAISGSNLDEFFMVRVATIKRQIRRGGEIDCPSGISALEVCDQIREMVLSMISRQYNCLNDQLLPGLQEERLCYIDRTGYTDEQAKYTARIFSTEIVHTLTPMRITDEEPFPFTANLRQHILFTLENTGRALVQIPPILKRVYWLPAGEETSCFTFLEDIILYNAGALFPGYTIADSTIFRITRDADLSVDEERDEDFLDAMSEVIQERKQSRSIRLSVSYGESDLTGYLMQTLGLSEEDCYSHPGPLNLGDFMGLAGTAGFDALRYPPWTPVPSPTVPDEEPLWDSLKQRDILLHHPYESFEPVVRLLNDAAADPNVLAIKATLYRTSGNSPVVKALQKAAENGKQVTALVELKARFDEERNIEWALQLERAGVIVVYGIAHLKVHAKALLIVRREPAGIQRYVHLATGNYNEKTAELYTDIGLLSAEGMLTYEVSLFFNAITGYSSTQPLNLLAMAPASLKNKILELIRREADRSTKENPGLIMAKLNSLADTDIIKGLYKASRAGVKIMLNVRGICMLVPGRKKMSSRISVVSIVGRFLEHSRIFYFSNGGQEEVYLSSADWMPRNLDRRVELMFPIQQERVKKRVIGLLQTYFRDTDNAHLLLENGTYEKKSPKQGESPFSAQSHFQNRALKADPRKGSSIGKEFTVRRTPPGQPKDQSP